MRIGLTGGIASGKSTVSRILRELGAFVSDADEAARKVVLPGRPALEAITALFGGGVLTAEGSLNRAELGRIVFVDSDKLKGLEAILHPAIREHMRGEMDKAESEQSGRLILADIPLLYETGQDATYDGPLVVYVPRELQLERLMERNGMDQTEAERRIELQMDLEEKRRRAQWVIDNSGSLEHTRSQVEKWMAELGFL